ncbi:MAG TPA: hypothetical protein VLL76_11785 [Candidatus Omnitrophota bacterium]|nr:hypothetical protein [Candidatus Omnitrophota bacterium]
MIRPTAVAALLLAWAAPAWASCDVLAARVDALPGEGAALLRSYDDWPEPALATAAFTYDNALAAIALVACDRPRQARRIGEALLLAAVNDRAGAEGRLRNAYRAGPQPDVPPPNGWWDAARGQWVEDAYQVGTATGNVAWAGLALVTLAEVTGDKRFRAGADRLAEWVARHAADRRGGFSGGIHGGEGAAIRLTWKSTEHNVDVAALFGRLDRGEARTARNFVASQFDGGHFWTGTLPDGVTVNRATSGLDAQLWPLLLEGAPSAWRKALDHAERAHGVDGGFDFNDDRDGLWVEGTAQAALAYRAIGRGDRAALLLKQVRAQAAPGGYLYATREPRITTGLAIGPDSTTADFFYYRRPHLGATAWAVLAERGWNPFTGKRVD